MVNRITVFCLLVFVWISFDGCARGMGRIIDTTTLSVDEIEKVQAVRLIEANELDESSYKVIKKVKGLSCDRYEQIGWLGSRGSKYIKEASRKKAIEQAKIYAMRAGGNAITNLVCVLDAVDWSNNCWNSIECRADAIQVDQGILR